MVRVPSFSVNVFFLLLRPCLDNSVQCAAMFPQRPSLVICSDLMVQLLYIHDAAALRGAERLRVVSVDTFRDLRREKLGEKPAFFFFPHGDDPTKTFKYFHCNKSRHCSNKLNESFTTARFEKGEKKNRCASEQRRHSLYI